MTVLKNFLTILPLNAKSAGQKQIARNISAQRTWVIGQLMSSEVKFFQEHNL